MPFKSKAQAGAAFGGHLGPEMKKKAHKWAQETPNMEKLPQHVKEVDTATEDSSLNEAALIDNVYFWLVEKPENEGVDPMTLVYPSPEEKNKKERRGMDPFEFSRMVLGGLTPDQIHGFYMDENDAINAAHDLVVAVNEAAKALEEKKAVVTEKIEQVIKKLQEKVNRCMEEGLDEEAQMYLEKIKDLRSKNEIVEASKKQIEKLEEGWFDRQVASAKGTGAAVGTGIRNVGRAIMGKDTKSVSLAKNVAKLSQKAKTLDKAIVDMENDMNLLFSPDKLNKAPDDFKKTLSTYRATLKQVKNINGAFMKGGANLPTDQKAAADQSTQGDTSQQQSATQQSTGGGQQQQPAASSTSTSANQQQSAAPATTKLKFDGKEYTPDKEGKVRVTIGGKRVRITPIDFQGTKIIPLVKDKQGKIQQIEKKGDKLYIKGTDREVVAKRNK